MTIILNWSERIFAGLTIVAVGFAYANIFKGFRDWCVKQEVSE